MRIKRQRRKLRGKYSGNCLSCAAKWSKCWYIASVDNQHEWETRLSKVVTPCEDEVCFQCWDAKIRTSPKRKIHFKTELPPVPTVNENINTLNMSRPSKRVERNKKRALNTDFTYLDTKPPTKRTTSIRVPVQEDSSFDEKDEDEGMLIDDDSDSSDTISLEDGLLFEEDAVIILSTAFRTIPIHLNDVNMNININITGASITANNSINCLPDIAKQIINEDSSLFDDLKAKKRGAYYCGKCGKLKKGHVCTSPTPPLTSSSDSIPNLSPTLESVTTVPLVEFV